MNELTPTAPEWTKLANVAAFDLGTRVIAASDEFFAEANRMLQTTDAVFIADKYDDNGKWMDGWETRRRRDGNNDSCLIKLGVSSSIVGFDIDTSHFTGNYAPAIAIVGCTAAVSDDEIINNEEKFNWINLLNLTALKGDSHHFLVAQDTQNIENFTHLKITIYPDGGIARLRAFGHIRFDETLYQAKQTNVIAALSGARAVYANDEHFGSLQNILSATEPKSMAGGWETRRRRKPGNDWGIIALAKPAVVAKVQISTQFFKGNFPHSFSICAGYHSDIDDNTLISKSMFWQELIAPQPLIMDSEQLFDGKTLLHQNTITHIRLNIFPDGGVARLKLLGKFIK